MPQCGYCSTDFVLQLTGCTFWKLYSFEQLREVHYERGSAVSVVSSFVFKGKVEYSLKNLSLGLVGW